MLGWVSSAIATASSTESTLPNTCACALVGGGGVAVAGRVDRPGAARNRGHPQRGRTVDKPGTGPERSVDMFLLDEREMLRVRFPPTTRYRRCPRHAGDPPRQSW